MSRIETIRDPITGDQITFVGPEASEIAQSIAVLAARHQMMILEVYRMLRVAMFGPQALDDKFDPVEELEKLQAQAEQANALFQFSLPIDEALAIFRRGRDALRLTAALYPERAAAALQGLAEGEREMERAREKAQAMLEKKRRLGDGQ